MYWGTVFGTVKHALVDIITVMLSILASLLVIRAGIKINVIRLTSLLLNQTLLKVVAQ